MFRRRLLAPALFFLTAVPAWAGPTIIRDTRVKDLGTTPVLGRGYSISTNTFQSTCLKDVVITEPSYDFQYLFKEQEKDSTTTTSSSTSAGGSYSNWWVSATVQSAVTSASERKVHAHFIQVTLNMDRYYASVNESGTPLSESASQLLAREDVPGFFAACGPYYVRGINRNAQLVSLFIYETSDEKRDVSFEASLQLEIKAFGSGSANASHKSTFGSTASSKNLTIITRGWGLGKNEDASLISYDLDTFKAAVKQAFISMQNPLTGRVTSVEIVPWVENTEFQVKLNMNATDTVSGKEVPLYEKKDILTFNGEFLTELERASRARLNAYYQAKMCKSYVLAKWSSDGKTLLPDVAKQPLKNHRLGPADPKPLTAQQLFDAVSEKSLDGLWKEYSNFTFGSGNSMRSCLAKLMADPNEAVAGKPPAQLAVAMDGTQPQTASTGTGRGLFLKRFLDHPECVAMQANFVPPKQAFEDYCMPELRSEP